MKFITKSFIAIGACFLCAQLAFAENFIIKGIQFEGLQRVAKSAALNYMPVQVGQKFSTEKSEEIIKALFATGFFQDISVVTQNAVLIVKVVERPTIGSLEVVGNKDIPKDKLDAVLKSMNLVQGAPFDKAALEQIRNALQKEYQSRGNYNALVVLNVTPLERNRVAVKLEISEGEMAKVAKIDIIGNKAFSRWTLLNQFELTTSRPWSIITRGDRYSKEKLDISLEALRNYYLDRGYLAFKIESQDVQLNPDKKTVDITIRLHEGERYTIKGYKLLGNLILPEQKLRQLVDIQPNTVFSKKEVAAAGEAIGRALGNLGYAFANVNGQTDIDEANKQVTIIFYLEPGKRIYVRRINFIGNTKTSDQVLRHQVQQIEGGLIATDKIQESKRRLDLLGYLERVEPQTKPVPGIPDQVDIDFNVTEGPSAQAIASVGYGTQGVVFNASYQQNNFLGTGKFLGLNFQNTTISTVYSVRYNNPYYTPEGIQRGFSFYVQRMTPGDLNVARYTTNTYGGSVNYGIPITAYSNLQLGYGLQRLELGLGSSPSTQLQDFVKQHGTRFNQLLLSAGWSRNRLDKANFPTKGLNQELGAQVSAPIGGAALKYYKTSYAVRWYYPLNKDFVFSTLGNFGYGNGYAGMGNLPFFMNYYAGGTSYAGAVRGYAPYSLGPVDSNGDPLGGNLLTAGSVGIIFPNPMMERVRTTAFVDVGNVYNTHSTLSSGPLRSSVGVSADWRVPMLNFLLNVSLAYPINPQPGDQRENFQFNIGTSF